MDKWKRKTKKEVVKKIIYIKTKVKQMDENKEK